MSTKPYTPLPGSVASRAITWLMDQPVGSTHSCAVIADAVEFDPNIITPCLAPAVLDGILIKERIDGRVTYRIGNGLRIADPDTDVIQVWTPATQATVQAEPKPKAPKPAATKGPIRLQGRPMGEELAGVAQAPALSVDPSPFPSPIFFVGASMGGDVQIHKNGVRLTLTGAEFTFAMRMALALQPTTETLE